MKQQTVLYNAAIFDGVHDQLMVGKHIILEEGKIKKIVETKEWEPDAQVIDVSGYTISPGFIDCHMHILIEEVAKDKEHVMTVSSPGGEMYPNADVAAVLRSVENCRKLLAAGFTTILDGGGRNFAECALKEAIKKEMVVGPELLVAGKQLTTNKAHFVGFSMEPYGPYGMRKAVRDLMWWGVDFIKMQMSPPIRLIGRNIDAVDFTLEEAQAAIDEAHNYGVPVHAHLRGATAIKRFLQAGGDYVVHGTGMDEEGIEMMLEKKKILLPTLLSPTPYPSQELMAAKPKEVLNNLAHIAEVQWESVRKAWKAGVKIAFSTDMGCLGNHIGENWREFFNLQEIGMSPCQALQSATSVAAEVVGRSHELGQVKEGYVANLVALKGNPLEDLSAVKQVAFTMVKGNMVYDGRS